MGDLGIRMVQCVPLTPQLKTDNGPQQQTRLADSDASRFRV